MPKLIRKNMVGFSVEEVRPRVTPRNKLRPRSYWFEFDDAGNVIDTDAPNEDHGPGLTQLQDEARQFWEDSQDPDFF